VALLGGICNRRLDAPGGRPAFQGTTATVQLHNLLQASDPRSFRQTRRPLTGDTALSPCPRPSQILFRDSCGMSRPRSCPRPHTRPPCSTTNSGRHHPPALNLLNLIVPSAPGRPRLAPTSPSILTRPKSFDITIRTQHRLTPCPAAATATVHTRLDGGGAYLFFSLPLFVSLSLLIPGCHWRRKGGVGRDLGGGSGSGSDQVSRLIMVGDLFFWFFLLFFFFLFLLSS